MGHVALYRQFRPVTFDEIVEQKHAVAALRQSVISGQIGHAYLFCGTRGTGKTSIAKIFSRAINCLAPRDGNPCNECEICRGILDNTLMDVIEMDAASNNSVDNIRRVCDEVMFLPSRTKYKVYIIDEVHMLSGGAFNALLKTLEEPPAHAVFILATTEPHRIPATIISRCQRYDFRRIPVESMVHHLQSIADAQQVSIDHDALVTISNLSDGALRDAISLLDQVSTGINRNITRDDVLRITGVVDNAFLYSMSDALLSGDAPGIVNLTEQLVMDGRDMIRFTLDLAHYFRDLMVIRVTPDPEILVQATSDSMAQMQELAGRTPTETLVFAVTRLSGLVSELKWSPDMRTSFEIALLSFGAAAHGAVSTDKSPAAPATSLLKSTPAASSTSVVTERISQPVDAPPVDAPPVDAPPVDAPPVDAPPVDAPPADAPPADAPPADAPHPSVHEVPFQRMMESAPSGKTAPETRSTKGRAYMAPPSIEDMSSTASPVSGTAAASMPLTPMEATLLAPPEEETYFAPPFETPIFDSVPAEEPLPLVPPLEENHYMEEVSFLQETPLEEPILPATVIEQEVAIPLFEAIPELPQTAEVQLPLQANEESPAFLSDGNLRGLPLFELWAALLHKWEDTLFSDALQLKLATVYEKAHVFYIVFPDQMRAYADNLTERPDYKKISKDILTVISGISSVEVQTQSMSDGLGGALDLSQAVQAKAAAQPDWVAQMLAFSEATGIPVETLDNL